MLANLYWDTNVLLSLLRFACYQGTIVENHVVYIWNILYKLFSGHYGKLNYFIMNL